MAGQNENPKTPQSQGSGSEGDDKKLYAGKYKTVEELEHAYKESETRFHESRQRESEIGDRLDRIEQRFATPVEYDEGYGRGQAGDPQDTEILAKFYSKPGATLRELKEQAKAELRQELSQESRRTQDYTARVNQWSQNNQDVAQYGDLLTFYVQNNTDGRLSPEKRLDQAAELVRKRVAQLKGNPKPGEPDPEEFVDGASGGRGTRRAAPEPKPTDMESELASYAAQRNAKARKPLGLHGQG